MGCTSCSINKAKQEEELTEADFFLSKRRFKGLIILENIQDYYNLEQVIGRGYFGTVRKARPFSCYSTEVAVKTIPKKSVRSKLTLLEQELECLMAVDHPNIIRVFEVFEDSAYIHLVTELCKGGELFERMIVRESFSESEASHIMYQLFHAVSHLHSLNITHRDVKPENILFSSSHPNADVKLIDFGLSKKFRCEEELQSIVGTPHYIAPEVLVNKACPASDVWSLGIIMYMLLSGHPPFRNTADLYDKTKLEGLKNLPNVSDDAQDLLNKLLDVNPETRINASQTLEHPWLARKTSPVKREDALRRLRKSEVQNKFKREVIKVIVRSSGVSEIHDLTEIFREIDKDHTGYISPSELQGALNNIGLNLEETDVHSIIRKVDFAGNGKINYSEFISCTIDLGNALSNEAKKLAFRYFDHDNRGVLTPLGIRKTLKRVNASLHDREIHSMLDEAQLVGDISFEQFSKIFEK